MHTSECGAVVVPEQKGTLRHLIADCNYDRGCSSTGRQEFRAINY